ncbi:uncharacterized protein N7459_009255 [Penicillium hispanicum]|uniref:uncharacterized protein n=1 Tax=Penicillium hispanicum TaxID=1080232 RepID=UPI0025404FC9|nr:uncharacterized protein N7459_009255 [Penicillium hispanicum]KAJ5569825.1 hypothetical protein N7459_009255 [Penicillium hispanicum]
MASDRVKPIYSTTPQDATARQNTQSRAAAPSNFLWVDYNDEKTRDQKVSRNKRAFVRTRNHRIQREGNLQKLKSSITPFPVGQAPLTPEPESPEPLSEPDQLQSVTGHADQYAPVVVPSLQAGIAEAFPSLSTASNANLYFNYYRFYISKVAFPFSGTSMTSWLFESALDQPALTEVILFLSAGSRVSNLITQRASTREINSSTRDLLQLRSQTIKSLQQILTRASDVRSEITVLIITNLLCAEAALANMKAVDAHIIGLKNIIGGLGGLDTLSNLTLSTVYCCDLMRGLLKRSPPIFDLSARWVRNIQTESAFIKAHRPLSSPLGPRFSTSSWSQDFPSELRSVIESFRQLIPLYESIYESDSRVLSSENDYLLLLIHRLYSMPYDCSLSPLQDTIRLSILLYAVVRIWKFSGKPCMENFVQILRQTFEKSFSILENTAPDLLFWILFMGVLATPGLPSRAWCLERTRTSAKKLGLKTWMDAKQVLEQFFFVCRPHGEIAKDLWLLEVEGPKRIL